MIPRFRIISMLSKNIQQPISSKSNSTMRFLSGQQINKPMTYLQRNILKERNHILPFMILTEQERNKRTSANLCEAFNYWLDVPKEILNEIWDITDSTHNFIITFDDVLDNSVVRRSLPTANIMFGVESTLTAMNFIQYIILDAAVNLGHPDAVKIVRKYIQDSIKGLSMEIYWAENSHIPTEEEFEECTMKKLCSPLRGQTNLMKLFSKNKYDFDSLLTTFAKYYQIRDDYNELGLHSIKNDAITEDDIKAGTYSFPIVHALRNNPKDYQIDRILKLRTSDVNIKKHLISLLDKYGSLEYTRNTINKLELQVRDEIEKLGGNPLFTKLMDQLSSTGISTKESII